MCNDRIAWAYDKVASQGTRYDLVINVQGDQPLVFPEMLDSVLAAAKQYPQTKSFTMVESCSTLEDFYDLNRVKVIFREKDQMLIYMTRAPIPSPKKKGIVPDKCYKHVAIIAFRPAFLREFLDFGMTYNESVEGIDYNRVIEMGELMHVSVTDRVTDTVDTEEDLRRVNGIMRTDPLWTSRAYHATGKR
jgi:3-deoxy-manno-octulosonate cytidylyltransferase (CMP-KDO synthetase)